MICPFSVHQVSGFSIGEDRSVETYVGFVDPAVAAFSDRAGHLAFEAHPDLFFRNAVLKQFESCEFHHDRRSDNSDCVVVAEGIEGDILDEGRDKSGALAFFFIIVEGVGRREMIVFFPLVKLVLEHDSVFVLETADERQIFYGFRIVGAQIHH